MVASMVFFVHFLVFFGALCAFALTMTVRFVVLQLRWAKASAPPAESAARAAAVTERVASLPVARPTTPTPATAPRGARPELLGFDEAEATLVETDPTRTWLPPWPVARRAAGERP